MSVVFSRLQRCIFSKPMQVLLAMRSRPQVIRKLSRKGKIAHGKSCQQVIPMWCGVVLHYLLLLLDTPAHPALRLAAGAVVSVLSCRVRACCPTVLVVLTVQVLKDEVGFVEVCGPDAAQDDRGVTTIIDDHIVVQLVQVIG